MKLPHGCLLRWAQRCLAAACFLVVCTGAIGTTRASDDDDEKPAAKSPAAKDRAADEALFEELDENEDGWLSGSEMKAYKSYDLDGNKRVTKVEFLAGQAKTRLTKVKPGDKTDPDAAPSVEPPVAPPGETPVAPPAVSGGKPSVTPAAGGNNAILPALGSLASSHAVLTQRYLALLTTAFEKGGVPAKETEQAVLDLDRQMRVISEYLNAAKGTLSPSDREFISSVQEIHLALKTQATQLVLYSRTKDDKHQAAVRAAEAAVLEKMQKVFGGGPQGGGTASDPEQTVNAAAAEGNKLAELAGKKFTTIFADANLEAFPGNREEFRKNAKSVADLLSGAAAKYREAATLCEKASQKAGGTGDARYWSLKGRSFRRIAESKEGFKSIALLIDDETIQDKATFESRAKPLIEEAIEVNTESQKLSKEAADLWKKLHPKE